MPNTLVDDTVPVLIEILRDIPYIDFDRCLAWDGMFPALRPGERDSWHIKVDWSLPDQLVAATVSALLRIASVHAGHREAAMSAIRNFVSQIVAMLCKGECT